MFVLISSTTRAQVVNFKNTVSYEQEPGVLQEMVDPRSEEEYIQNECSCATQD